MDQVFDAFSRLPFVEKMKAAESLQDFLACESEDEKADACNLRIDVCDHRCDAPAHFPPQKFGINGENIDGAGAIIYEGMRFAVQTDGRHQIRFVAGTPAVPVTFRLQLILADDDDGNRYTLTLPPISIPKKVEPRRTSEDVFIDQVYAATQTVHHEGYLPLLVGRSQIRQHLDFRSMRPKSGDCGYCQVGPLFVERCAVVLSEFGNLFTNGSSPSTRRSTRTGTRAQRKSRPSLPASPAVDSLKPLLSQIRMHRRAGSLSLSSSRVPFSVRRPLSCPYRPIRLIAS